jgi:hypothetical protein
VRRFVFAPRWVVGHVLVVVAVVSCGLLGRWQWHRAEFTHSLQNYAYALQWPMFAVFFLFMWWRMLRLESWRLDDEARAVAGGDSDVPGSEPERPVTPVVTPVPAAVLAASGPDEEDDDDRQLAAYNRMLAELAARDRAEP